MLFEITGFGETRLAMQAGKALDHDDDFTLLFNIITSPMCDMLNVQFSSVLIFIIAHWTKTKDGCVVLL